MCIHTVYMFIIKGAYIDLLARKLTLKANRHNQEYTDSIKLFH